MQKQDEVGMIFLHVNEQAEVKIHRKKNAQKWQVFVIGLFDFQMVTQVNHSHSKFVIDK